jgi:hypothetical protein
MKRIGPLLPIGAGDTAVHFGSRRRAHRYPINAEVTVIEPIVTEGVALNASAGGIRIMVVDEIAAGEPCLLELHFTEERRSLEKARVVWSREHSDGWVMGLEFLDITWSIPSGDPRAA